MPITNRPPDLQAEITFLATAHGGRRSPVYSGYRPSHDFGLQTLNDGAHEYVGCTCVAPGETAVANMWLIAPEYQRGRLYPGFKFTVQEGPRVVAHGVVQRVFNTTLEKTRDA